MNLYELTGAALQLQKMLEDGEIEQEAYQDTVECLDIDTKVENICKVIRNLEAKAKMFKEEKDRLAEREKTAKNGVERLKESLLLSMKALQKEKIESGVFKVAVVKSKSVKVIDETRLPEEYLIYQPSKIDKTAIAKALKEGVDVSGAEFEHTEHVRIW